MPKKNMYSDSVKQWNCIVGCKFDCIYCEKSFKNQMKRQKHNCEWCGVYLPHFHRERLTQSLPQTSGDEFIWVASSSDIWFADLDWLHQVYDVIDKNRDKTFFFQSKNPEIFRYIPHRKNILFGITLETTGSKNYGVISKAPSPYSRFSTVIEEKNDIKIDIVTIEPIIDFDLKLFSNWIHLINPQRVYVGYDTKHCHLPEPPLDKTLKLIEELKTFTKVKPKLLREAHWVLTQQERLESEEGDADEEFGVNWEKGESE